MARRDLVERLQEAFKDPQNVQAEEYQRIIEANVSKAAESAQLLTFLLMASAMIVILVSQGRITKIDLGGFLVIDDPSIILITLPILIAYIQYDLITTLSKFEMLSVIHKAIIKQRHRPIHDQRLTEYFLFLPTIYEYKYFSTNAISNQIQSTLRLVQFFSITIVVPLGSQAASYLNLIQTPPELGNSLLLVASLIITLVFDLQSILTTIELFRDVGD